MSDKRAKRAWGAFGVGTGWTGSFSGKEVGEGPEGFGFSRTGGEVKGRGALGAPGV